MRIRLIEGKYTTKNVFKTHGESVRMLYDLTKEQFIEDIMEEDVDTWKYAKEVEDTTKFDTLMVWDDKTKDYVGYITMYDKKDEIISLELLNIIGADIYGAETIEEI